VSRHLVGMFDRIHAVGASPVANGVLTPCQIRERRNSFNPEAGERFACRNLRDLRNRTMTRTFVKAITAAALISGAALASQPAFAMGFKNCTGQQIRVKIYNNNDASRLVAKRNKTLGVNDYHWFKLDSKNYQVLILKSRAGKDEKVHLKGGLNGGHKFSVRRSGGRYHISTVNDCAKKAPPKPVKTIQIDKGRWDGGRNRITIRNVTGNSFELRLKGRKGWSRYTLIGKDRYRDSGGNVFVMTSRGQAVWNGVRYTKK